MLAVFAQAGAERVVVKTGQVVAPKEKHRKAGVKHIAERDTQALRPGVGLTKRSRRPIELPGKFPHFTAAVKEGQVSILRYTIHFLSPMACGLTFSFRGRNLW